MEKNLNIGFAITGSFCTHEKILNVISELKTKGHNIVPIFSFNTKNISTRYGASEGFATKIELICQNDIVDSIVKAEPVGPKNLIDVLIIAPCTGNTLAKLANAISDGPVTMVAKAHLRNNKPVVIGISTNDALGLNLKNIATLLTTKNIFFVPFSQDNPNDKPNSLICNWDLIEQTTALAMQNKQIQPLLQVLSKEQK